VKDILGIDMEFGVIETEKRFEPKVAYVDFKLDIFAESKDKRVIVEIQKIEYDYNFDRFLHYFLMSIAELQRSSKEYKMSKTVYTIVVLTAPYTISDKSQSPVKNEVLISKLNPQNLKGEEIDVFGHQLVFLNSYHRDDFTPKLYRDWLDLIYQSIHNSENPQINYSKEAIKKAAEIIDIDNLTPEERAESKKSESIKAAKKVYEDNAEQRGIEKGIEKEKTAIIQTLIAQNILNDEQIALVTNTTVALIQKIRQQL
jgi:predicted transposase/invertase (TIGR01784 family)